jgi:hypothetical protein
MRRLHTSAKFILPAMILAGSPESLRAQTSDAPSPQNPQAAAKEGGPPKVQPEKLTSEQKRVQTENFLSAQRRGLARLAQFVSEARAQQDMIQLNCLNSKLEQVKGLLRISETASANMYEGMAQNDQQSVNNQFTRIALASYKSEQLLTEANQCVGAEAVFTGETRIDVRVDGDVPTVDPTAPLPPPVGPVVPPVSSGS